MADQSEASVFIVGPHSSHIDAAIMVLLDTIPYAVSSEQNGKMPIIGKLMKLAQPVYVYREDKDSRLKTIAELKRRAQSGGIWPQFLIFPEGTTTNRKALISFKAGGFIPAMPVQPVVLRYPDEWDSVTWTWEGPGAAILLWMCLCKLWTTLEIEFLPVYNPSEEEKADPYLYAENVRKVMAKALNMQTTDHTFEDCRLMLSAKRTKLQMGDALIEYRKVQKKLGLDYDMVHSLLERYSSIPQLDGTDGQVDIETFSKYLGLPVSDPLRELFDLYDTDGSGHIDFREYVIGMCIISQPAKEEESVRLVYQLFDKNSKGYVSREEFSDALTDALNAQGSDAQLLYDKIDATGAEKFTLEDFQRYALDMPEVVSLFTTYLKLKESGHQFESAQSPEIGHPGSLENGQPGSSEDISTNEKKMK